MHSRILSFGKIVHLVFPGQFFCLFLSQPGAKLLIGFCHIGMARAHIVRIRRDKIHQILFKQSSDKLLSEKRGFFCYRMCIYLNEHIQIITKLCYLTGLLQTVIPFHMGKDGGKTRIADLHSRSAQTLILIARHELYQ